MKSFVAKWLSAIFDIFKVHVIIIMKSFVAKWETKLSAIFDIFKVRAHSCDTK